MAILSIDIDISEYGEEIELTEDSECVRLSSGTKYIGSIEREDTSSMLLFGDNFSLDYSDDEASIVSIDDLETHALTRMLIIDEIDTHQDKYLGPPQIIRATKRSKHPKNEKMEACPCCQSFVKCQDRSRPVISSLPTIDVVNSAKESLSSASFINNLWKINEDKTTECYEIKRSLAEGWLYKKGTGNDIFRSRSWKPRWVNLVLASINGYEIDVPVMLVSWHSSMPYSNVIILDSAVAIAVDWESKKENQPDLHCFDIGCVKNGVNNDGEIRNKFTRSFCAPLEERDQWTREITQTLLDYEKNKSIYRKRKARRLVNYDSNNSRQRMNFRTSQSLPPVFPLKINEERSLMLNGFGSAN